VIAADSVQREPHDRPDCLVDARFVMQLHGELGEHLCDVAVAFFHRNSPPRRMAARRLSTVVAARVVLTEGSAPQTIEHSGPRLGADRRRGSFAAVEGDEGGDAVGRGDCQG
jgi:hypothetical protein